MYPVGMISRGNNTPNIKSANAMRLSWNARAKTMHGRLIRCDKFVTSQTPCVYFTPRC